MQDILIFISQHWLLTTALVIVLVLLMIVEVIRLKQNTFNISPLQTTQLINHENATVIDIRTTETFKKGHIIGANAISAQEIRENSKKLEKFKTRPLIIVCNAGIESQKIATLLLKQGYNVYSLHGGMRAWSEAEMPIVKES